MPNIPRQEIPEPPSSSVAIPGRGGYTWLLSGYANRFKPQLPYDFFDELESDTLEKAMTQPIVGAKLSAEDLKGLGPDVKEYLRRLLDQKSKPKSKLVIKNDKAKGIQFDMDPDGRRVLVCGDEIQVWDMESASLVAKFLSPEECIGCYLTKNVGECILVTKKGVAVHKFESGEKTVQHSTDLPVVGCDATFDGSVALVCQAPSGLEVLVLDAILKPIAKSPVSSFQNARIRFHQDGNYIVGYGDRPVRWEYESNPEIVETIEAGSEREGVCVASKDSEFWLGRDSGVQSVYSKNEKKWKNHSLILTSRVVDAEACRNDKIEWALILGQRLNDQGAWYSFLQDVTIASGYTSAVQPLSEPAYALRANKDGQRIAIVFADRIEVMDRVPLIDPYGWLSLIHLSGILKEGRFAEFEKVAKLIRRQPNLLPARDGEALYTRLMTCTTQVLGEWQETISNEKDPVARATQSKSFIAALDWMQRNPSIGKHVSFFLKRYQSGNNGVAEFQLAEFVDQILVEESPPSFAYAAKIARIIRGSRDTEEIGEIVLESVKKYPQIWSVHCEVGYSLSYEEANLYLNKVADKYPKPLADGMYTEMYCEYCDGLDEPKGAVYSSERLVKGADVLQRLGILRPRRAEQVFNLIKLSKTEDLELIPKWFVRNVTVLSQPSEEQKLKILREVRDREWKQADLGEKYE